SSALPSGMMPLPASKIIRPPPARTSTQAVWPPKYSASTPTIGNVPRAPQTLTSIAGDCDISGLRGRPQIRQFAGRAGQALRQRAHHLPGHLRKLLQQVQEILLADPQRRNVRYGGYGCGARHVAQDRHLTDDVVALQPGDRRNAR